MVNLTLNNRDFGLDIIQEKAMSVLRLHILGRPSIYLYGFHSFKGDVALHFSDKDVAPIRSFLEEKGFEVVETPDYAENSLGFSKEMRENRIDDCVACVVFVALAVHKRLLKAKSHPKTDSERWAQSMRDLDMLKER